MNLETLNEVKQVNINNFNNKIDVRYLKDKKSKRTFISGLQYFLSDDEIKNLVLVLKKKLGAGVSERESENGIEYGFQGDHLRKIKEMIMENAKVPKDAFN